MINKIEDIIKDAGILAQSLLTDDLEIHNKSAQDWVTNIDITIEKFLVENILKVMPEANFLAEENTHNIKGSDHLFIIDPIDGTTNLIHQKQNFAISVAYYHQSQPQYGFVFDVMGDKLYKGISGDRAYLNGVPFSPNKNRRNEPLKNGLLFGDIYRKDLFKKPYDDIKSYIAAHRFLGSCAIEICEVAFEKAHAYVFPKITIWDGAAALIILKCTGGTWYFDNEIEGYPLNDKKSIMIACLNDSVLQELLQWI